MLVRDSGEDGTQSFLDCLALARQVGDQFNVGEALAGLSSLAARDGHFEDAARLAGASAALHEQIGAPPWESVTAMHERALAGARDALGSSYDAYFAEGRELPAEDAVGRLQSAALST